MTMGARLSVRVAATIAIALASGASRRLDGQARPDSARCDSIVAVAAVDSVQTGIFVFVQEIGTDLMTDEQRDAIESRLSQSFVPPRPFRLSVFEGPSLVRGLRISSSDDSLGVLRAPSVTGTYLLDMTDNGDTKGPDVVRSSLLPGFDSAMVGAIRSAASMGPAMRPIGGDRWQLQIRVSNDSLDGARRIAEGRFPRMRVRNASVLPAPRPAFPSVARADSIDYGEVVLRFVVDRDHKAALETIEVVRASATEFVRAAIVALGSQTFNPATIRGCPVAQLVDLAFIFDDRDRPPAHNR